MVYYRVDISCTTRNETLHQNVLPESVIHNLFVLQRTRHHGVNVRIRARNMWIRRDLQYQHRGTSTAKGRDSQTSREPCSKTRFAQSFSMARRSCTTGAGRSSTHRAFRCWTVQLGSQKLGAICRCTRNGATVPVPLERWRTQSRREVMSTSRLRSIRRD
jgi:hypothetical protein